SRAIVYDAAGAAVATAQEEFPQIYPADGWVEHDPEAIWATSLSVMRAAMKEAEAGGGRIAAIGVTNQRETTIVWNRETGAPIYNAIVWQDRRTAPRCATLKEAGHEATVREKTGLVLDPYFSATKVAWILDNVEGAREAAQKGALAFGTVDSFLIWRLTGGTDGKGARHLTDVTNASRTSLYNINSNDWDEALLEAFDVPRACLPDVRDCADDFGETDPSVLGRAIPIAGVAGDQQAAAIGQAGFSEGAIKSTYGTGCFVLAHTGTRPVSSSANLLTTIAYRLNGETAYALEGSIFVAGAAVQWLRDELEIIKDASETDALARSLPDNQGVYLVPAFAGLGAPHWRPDARGAVYGLTRGAGKAALARAALECVAYQTLDLMDAIAADGVNPTALRVDGGMVANDWMVQFLADILDITVERPVVMETTALGAAYLAGLKVGMFASLDEVAALWKREAAFEPAMESTQRTALIDGWRSAIRKTLLD
ncbi:MAG: glycerol kinase GlpK, partial [Pseudomonadota bacterium]